MPENWACAVSSIAMEADSVRIVMKQRDFYCMTDLCNKSLFFAFTENQLCKLPLGRGKYT